MPRACGSAEGREGSQAQEMWDAFGSLVYLGWDDEVQMQHAAFAEVGFFQNFSEKVSVADAVREANRIAPAKIERESGERKAILLMFERSAPNVSYKGKELKEAAKPTPQ